MSLSFEVGDAGPVRLIAWTNREHRNAFDPDDRARLADLVDAATVDGVRALILQPRAQNPTGASLTPERVAALAAVLADPGVLVIEDDSSGAVASTPALSLGSVLPSSTVHIRSYSKSHGPDLRIAAVGGPATVLDADGWFRT
ncbi:MAG: hypothetical protein J0H43_02720, partial [Actinobacteria bacterium]|nr:hypothetical protein [Actinomycetota bacterium]